MKKINLLVLCVVMIISLCACGGNGNSDEDSNTSSGGEFITVQIEIDYPDESGVADVDDLAISIPDGSNVMDALNKYADDNDCEIVMSDESATAYVVSIGGIAATDTAGWIYEINDEMVMEAADKCVLNDGDEVSWSFESWD